MGTFFPSTRINRLEEKADVLIFYSVRPSREGGVVLLLFYLVSPSRKGGVLLLFYSVRSSRRWSFPPFLLR